jgi:uncharacterized membrane protein YjfL (UPF0719 family)
LLAKILGSQVERESSPAAQIDICRTPFLAIRDHYIIYVKLFVKSPNRYNPRKKYCDPETRKGNFALALALGFILMGLAFLLNFTMYHLERRGARQ